MILFGDGTRLKHFLYAIPAGLLLTVLFAAGLAVGMEFKDRQWGGCWDWWDLLWTVIGGMLGQLLQIGLLCVIF